MSRSKVTNSNGQTTNKIQTPMSNKRVLFFGYCVLFIICNLFIVIFSDFAKAQEQNDGISLDVALAANEHLKKEITQLRQDKQDLFKNIKALTVQNAALKAALDKTQVPTPQPQVLEAQQAPSNGELQRLRKELADTHYNLGVMLQDQARFDDALKEYEKTLEANPLDADAHYNLALILDEEKKDASKALGHYQKYLELNPQAPEAQRVKESIVRLGG